MATSPTTNPAISLASFDQDFAHHLVREVRGQLPEEKARENLRQVQLWKQMQAAGSLSMPGLGQKIASISARTFFRWQNEFPGCWNDQSFVKQMLKDNPQLCAPGYNPGGSTKIFDMGATHAK